MKVGAIIGIVVAVSVILFIVINLIIWYRVSRQHYGKRIRAGDKYNIGKRVYQVPNLPLEGDAKLLSESYLLKQRELLHQLTNMLDEMNVEYWLSGGTLLGFTRHKTFIPWDDDCDIHTHWKHREYMFSSQFGNDISVYDLEAIFLIGASTKFATREAAAVRIRRKKTLTPVCDVFFVKEMTPNIFSKVDSWNGNKLSFNTKERWEKQWLFPLEKKQVDELNLWFPRNPESILKQQYGNNALTKMYARNVLFSHLYPFSVLGWVWQKH